MVSLNIASDQRNLQAQLRQHVQLFQDLVKKRRTGQGGNINMIK